MTEVYSETVDIYAHRGFRSILPENTLLAYQAALKIGVSAVDMDINMTKDGVLVVTHDLTLNTDLTEDESGNRIKVKTPIKDLTLAELRKLDVGTLNNESDLAKLYPHHRNFKKVQIPTLLEVIRYVKSISGQSVKFQIEMKTDPLEPELSVEPKKMAKALYQILKQENIIDISEIQAFDWQCLVELERLNKNIQTAFLTSQDSHPISEKDDKNNLSGVYTAGLDPKEFNYNYLKMIKKLNGDFWEPYEMEVTQKDIIEAKSLGIKVVTWSYTEGEGTDFNYSRTEDLIKWQVDGIITDRPDILRGIEAANGLDVPKAFDDARSPYENKIGLRN